MWQKAVCDEEWDATAEDRRRIKWKKGNAGSAYKVPQVRLSPASQANTILKMAEKRATTNVVLKVTAASDIFTQDLEDDPDQHQQPDAKPPMKRPQAKGKAATKAKTAPAPNGDDIDIPANAISEKQRKRLYAIYKGAEKTDDEVKQHLLDKYGLVSSRQITWGSMYDEICAWAEAVIAPEPRHNPDASEPGDPDDIPY
jgi:hypothetical protein